MPIPDRPRSVWLRNGDMMVIRDVGDPKIEEFIVPGWAAEAIYERGRQHDETNARLDRWIDEMTART